MGQSYFGQAFVEIVGDPPLEESARPIADYQIASPSYFETLDLPVVTGRAFDDRDRADRVPVCMVNEAFVRRYFRGRSPIGMRLAIRPTSAPQANPFIREIVGVARQVKGRPDESGGLPPDLRSVGAEHGRTISFCSSARIRDVQSRWRRRSVPRSRRSTRDQLTSVEERHDARRRRVGRPRRVTVSARCWW